MPRIPPVCVLACLLAIATAQERRPQPGLVVDADGKPVVDAAVTLVFAPPFASMLGGADIVRATTDQQGRFRAELLAGADYTGWAVAVDAGSRLVDVVPGQQCELRLQPALPGRGRLRVGGTKDWQSAGPLQLRAWISSASGVLPDAALDGDGIATMPGLPDDPVMLELLDGRGQTIDLLYGGGRTVQAEVAPPQLLRALVVDDQGRPLAGATIARALNNWNGRLEPLPSLNEVRLVPLAVTGEDGGATLRIAATSDPFDGVARSQGLTFVASKAGHAASLSCFADKLYCDGKPASDEQRKARELRFKLAPAAPVRGQLHAAKDQPVAQIVLSVNATSFPSSRWNVAVAVDARGVFELPPVPPGTTVDTVYVPAVRPALADDDPFRRALAHRPLGLRLDDRYAMLRGPDGARPRRAAGAAPVVDLRDLQPLRLQVFDSQRGPARRAFVHLAPLTDEPDLGHERTPSPGTTDGAGRLAMALPRGGWRLFVAGVDGFVQQELQIGAEVPAPLELQLRPYEAMPLHVIDGNGKPVVGAEVQFARFSARGATSLNDHALRVTPWLLRGLSTDARGDCVVRFLSGKNMQFKIQVRDGSRWSDDLVLAAEERPLEVRLQ